METNKTRDVLVVDDQADSVQPLIIALQRSGARVRYAANSEQTLTALAEATPDIIVLDVMLGPEDGFELCRQIRGRPATAETPVLFLSGLGAPEKVLTGLKLGAGDYVIKPYDVRELVARLNLQMDLKERERQLSQRNAELRAAYDKLQTAQAAAMQVEKLAAIGRISAGVAHEMNTPLSFITSNLTSLEGYIKDIGQVLDVYEETARHCMEKEDGTETSLQAGAALAVAENMDIHQTLEEVRNIVAECRDGAELITKIAQGLREYSREEYEDRVVTDIHELLEKALTLARGRIGEDTRVECDYGNLAPVTCIPMRLTGLFLNLLVNAAQAIQHPPGLIRITTRPVGTEHVEITIADNGIGISEKNLPHVFEPFFTTKSAQQGTGLGLSIAQRIARLHGGDVTLASEVGRGTTVCVRLAVSGHGKTAA